MVVICSEKVGRGGYYGNGLLETGRMYITMGDYEKALPFAEESDAIYRQTSGDENPNSACSLTDIGVCRMHMGQPEEAEKALTESLRLNLLFNGPLNRQTFWAKEALADLALSEGKEEEASRLYGELEVEMEQSFGNNNPQLLSLRKKLADMEAAKK